MPFDELFSLLLEIIEIEHARLQLGAVGGLCPFGEKFAGAPYWVLPSNQIQIALCQA